MALNNSNANGIGGMLAIIDASRYRRWRCRRADHDGRDPHRDCPELRPVHGDRERQRWRDRQRPIQAAEVRADAAPVGPFPMSASDAAFDTATEAVTSTTGQIDTTTWAAGTHTVFVRGRDSLGNWGPYASTTVRSTGPGRRRAA